MIPLSIAVLASIFLLAPILIVVPISFSTAISFEFPPPGYWLGYYRHYFHNPDWLEATANSFIIASAVTAMTLVLVMPAALGFVRYRFAGKAVISLLIMLPLMVPQIVTALAYYAFLGGAGLTGTRTGMIMAHTALSMPVGFLILCAVLKGVDRNLERAAMMSGAGPIRTLLWVTLPVIRPGLLVAALFVFLTSFNEAVVASFIGGRDATTLPKKMFESIRLEADPVIAVVSTLLITIIIVGAIISRGLRSKFALPVSVQ
jgi:putative spermidine/putrescine transport system permease protein